MTGGACPSRDEFVSLAREWSIVPVWRELLADLTTPVAAYARLVQDEPGFILESVEHAGTWGRWSFIGRRPSATMTLRHGRVSVEGSLPRGRSYRPRDPGGHRGRAFSLPGPVAARAASAPRRPRRVPGLRRRPRGRTLARCADRRARLPRRHRRRSSARSPPTTPGASG